MKKLIALLMCMLLLLPAALAETPEPENGETGAAEMAEEMTDEDVQKILEVLGIADLDMTVVDPEEEEEKYGEPVSFGMVVDPDGETDTGALVTGPFDEPALKNPKDRYEAYVEETDGSEYPLFVVLDTLNDEAEEIEKNGALRITQGMYLDENGEPMLTVRIVMQNTLYGTVLITGVEYMGIREDETLYTIRDITFSDTNGKIERDDFTTQGDYDYYIESFHFPYGTLEAMNGMRQDDNGYTYILIRSDEDFTFEFVTANMHIKQLRVYERGDDDELELTSLVDYTLGEAEEIPQEVLDAFGEVLEPVTEGSRQEPEETEEP